MKDLNKIEDVRVTAHSIKWDTDGEDVSLPKEIDLIVPADWFDGIDEGESMIDFIEEYIYDEISNVTGFCHEGFDYDLKDDIPFFIANYLSEEPIRIFDCYLAAKGNSVNGLVYKAIVNHELIKRKDETEWVYEKDDFNLLIGEPKRVD